MTLFTQQARATEMKLPNPCVILNLDEAMDNASKDKASFDDSLPSDTLSKQVGGYNPNKGATLTGVEQQFDPLPDNYLFTYSATGDKPPGDDDELNKPVDLCDKLVSKFTFLERLAHYMDGNRISNCNQKAVELAIFAEAGTYVRGLDPMKWQKQEDVFMRKYM